MKKLFEIMSIRGRKGMDRSDQVSMLRTLLGLCNTQSHQLYILLALISTQFDHTISSSIYALPIDLWKQIAQDINQVLAILESRPIPDFVLARPSEDKIMEQDKGLTQDMDEKLATLHGAATHIISSLLVSVSRLDDDYQKSLLCLDPVSSDYMLRLKDELMVYAILCRSQAFFQTLDPNLMANKHMEKSMIHDSLANTTLRRLEHIYAKPAKVAAMFETRMSIHELACSIYQCGGERARLRALLAHIYNEAMEGRYVKARDLVLMSHIQNTISMADVPTQILYNRAIVQLGLAAFRKGHIKECQMALQDIFAMGRQRELLGQNLLWNHRAAMGTEKTALSILGSGNLMERQEWTRQVPYHMHLPVDLIEAVYLVASMIVEMPLAWAHMPDEETKYPWNYVNRQLKRLLEGHDKGSYNGPPESIKESIVEACHALMDGDWKGCLEWIQSMPGWKHYQPHLVPSDERLVEPIQEAAMHIYLVQLRHGGVKAVHVSSLVDLFCLDIEMVRRLVCSWIVSDLLHHAWMDGDLIYMEHVAGIYPRQTRLHHLAVQLAEKMNILFEEAERMFDQKDTHVAKRGFRQRVPHGRRYPITTA